MIDTSSVARLKMKTGINLGRSDSNSFKESKSVAITKLHLEKGRRIKTHFLEMDKTPNFDGKLMILDGDIERITVEVQIKTLPERVRFQDNGDFSFICDTKAMNCVLGKVTLNPVALFAVDTVRNVVYYKLLTRDYVLGLDIGIKKEVTIKFSRTDIFCEDDFISRVCQEVKITNTYTDCIIECTTIRKILRCAQYTYKEKYQLVYQRNEVKGFLAVYRYACKNEKSLLLCTIKMENKEQQLLLNCQLDMDYIHVNRPPTDICEIKDSDVANILLEIAKETEKPVLYTNEGKPIYWFGNGSLWQLRAEEFIIDLW